MKDKPPFVGFDLGRTNWPALFLRTADDLPAQIENMRGMRLRVSYQPQEGI
ncbi:hypothetical protein BOS5A_10379 [Bosea sp. EC-HK365B]|nr:hypothetical protein BOS5A_10379 [Bosea sp. EC-HK365B]